MTRRRPQAQYPAIIHPPDLASPHAAPPQTTPATQGDAIEPWAQSGGQTYYYDGFAFPDLGGPPELACIQLLAAQYIPRGRAGWIKRIMVAPCAPPFLVDPWRGWGGTANFFDRSFGPPFGSYARAAAQAGLWETPLAWEGYFNPAEIDNRTQQPFIPRWNWQLSVLSGSLATNRAAKNTPPFSILDPASWYLAPNIAVPIVVYGGSLLTGWPANVPGRAVNGEWGPQRIQQTPLNPMPCHIQIPEDSTVCLWATWTQRPYAPVLGFNAGGALDVFPTPPPGDPPLIWPLLPSVGSISGYMQTATREAAGDNAALGWGA